MASRKLTAKCYIEIDGEKVLWYEIDENRKVKWHLPKNIKSKEKMLNNISKQMSRYCSANPQSTLLST